MGLGRCVENRFVMVVKQNDGDEIKKIVWKKVEEHLRLFETYGGNQFSLSLMGSLRKLIIFWARMVLHMKLIAKKELILLFQMTPSKILCNRYFWSYEFLNLFLFFRIFRIFP